MMEACSVLAFVGAAVLATLLCRPRGVIDPLLAFPLTLVGSIVVAGYVLSALNVVGRIEAWALAGSALLGVAWLVTRSLARDAPAAGMRLTTTWRSIRAHARGLWSGAARDYRQLSGFEKCLLLPSLAVVAVLALLNFDLVVHVAPGNADSMTYHLARMAYYLQHGNLANFDANNWAQVTHPKNATVVLLFVYLASGRNENLTQLVQFASYAVAAVAVYGCSRRIGADRFSSLFAAAAFALLTECLMQATTTQNDLFAAALIGCASYACLAYRERGGRRYLAAAAGAAAIAIGVKASTLLAMPSLALVGAFALLKRGRPPARDVRVLVMSGAVALALFVLPAGYVENWRVYGNPMGPEPVRRAHTFEGRSWSYAMDYGTQNLLRFGFDFLSLDGLPPVGAVLDAQRALRWLPERAVEAAGLDLEAPVAARAPFTYAKDPIAHEDGSYWGVLGFALVWVVAVLALAGAVGAPAARILAAAGVVFWLMQAYSGPYDPWRGRYSVQCAVLVVPVVAVWVRRPHRWWLRAALLALSWLGCVSALSAVLWRINGVPGQLHSVDRLDQLTRNRFRYADPMHRFEALVPSNATVAVFFAEDMYEYPLFGERLTRRLIPVNGFYHGPSPIPRQADYLLYSSALYRERSPGDLHLGEDWYLRLLRSAAPGQTGRKQDSSP